MQVIINQLPMILGTTDKFPKLSLSLLNREPSLSACTMEAVFDKGGVLAKAALAYIKERCSLEIERAKRAGLSAVVDVKVHHLTSGGYPEPPGWHCDGIPRSMYTGEYNVSAIPVQAFNVAVTLSSEMCGVSCIEFVDDRIRVLSHDKKKIFSDVQEQVERIAPNIRRIKDGIFVKYSPKSIHRATETNRSGVRIYFRFSMMEKPEIQNIITPYQHIYLLSSKNGW